MKKQCRNFMKRWSVALLMLLTVGVVMAIVPDPRVKKKVSTTTTTTQKKSTTTTTPQKKSGTSSKNTTTKQRSSSSSSSSAGSNRSGGTSPATIQSSSDGAVLMVSLGNVSFRMIRVDGGTFTMGATAEQGSDAYTVEKPAHLVTLSTYYMGETEVTQELWEAVMGSNPSKFKGSRRPVEYVSWEDCQDFIRRLNQRTGRNFRLPTEAEWEYAARGGNKSYGYKYAGGSSSGDVAWYYGNSGNQTHDVATKRANELGLYDMSGNVWEWCQDWYSESYYSSSSQTNPTGPSSGSFRVYRGGSWYDNARSCRVSYRNRSTPASRNFILGLRLAL